MQTKWKRIMWKQTKINVIIIINIFNSQEKTNHRKLCEIVISKNFWNHQFWIIIDSMLYLYSYGHHLNRSNMFVRCIQIWWWFITQCNSMQCMAYSRGEYIVLMVITSATIIVSNSVGLNRCRMEMYIKEYLNWNKIRASSNRNIIDYKFIHELRRIIITNFNLTWFDVWFYHFRTGKLCTELFQ